MKSRQLNECDTFTGCFLVNLKSKVETLLSNASKNVYTLDQNNDWGYSIRCDVSRGHGESNYITFSYDNKSFTEWGYPRYMNGNAHEGQYVIPVPFLSKCGSKQVKVEGHIWTAMCFNRTYDVEALSPMNAPCDPNALAVPIKAPTELPTSAPAVATVPAYVPIKPTTIKPPITTPVKVPTVTTRVPVKASFLAPIQAPISPPGRIPTKAPVPKPIKTPVTLSVPVKAPAAMPVKATPATVPIKIPTFLAPVMVKAPVRIDAPVPVKAPAAMPVKATPETVPVKIPTFLAPVMVKAPVRIDPPAAAPVAVPIVPTPGEVKAPVATTGRAKASKEKMEKSQPSALDKGALKAKVGKAKTKSSQKG